DRPRAPRGRAARRAALPAPPRRCARRRAQARDGMTATLRPLTLEDLHRVLELETALFGAGAWSEWMLREEVEGPYRHYLALTVRETAAPAIALDPSTGPSQAPERELLVGYGGTWFDGRDAQIMTIGIAPTHQGRGYGRILLDALLAHERERGAEQVFL